MGFSIGGAISSLLGGGNGSGNSAASTASSTTTTVAPQETSFAGSGAGPQIAQSGGTLTYNTTQNGLSGSDVANILDDVTNSFGEAFGGSSASDPIASSGNSFALGGSTFSKSSIVTVALAIVGVALYLHWRK